MQLQPGDRITYPAWMVRQHPGFSEADSPVMTIGLSDRTGRFIRYLDPLYLDDPGFQDAVIKWDDEGMCRIVATNGICKCGSAEACDPHYPEAMRAIAWYARTTPEQRGHGNLPVPFSMDEILAIGPHLSSSPMPTMQSKPIPPVRIYQICGVLYCLCDGCMMAMRRVFTHSKPRTLKEQIEIREMKHPKFQPTERTGKHCERCGRLGPKRADRSI